MTWRVSISAAAVGRLLHDDGAEEVRAGILLGACGLSLAYLVELIEITFGDIPNVLPERLPLILLVPHVGDVERSERGKRMSF